MDNSTGQSPMAGQPTLNSSNDSNNPTPVDKQPGLLPLSNKPLDTKPAQTEQQTASGPAMRPKVKPKTSAKSLVPFSCKRPAVKPYPVAHTMQGLFASLPFNLLSTAGMWSSLANRTMGRPTVSRKRRIDHPDSSKMKMIRIEEAGSLKPVDCSPTKSNKLRTLLAASKLGRMLNYKTPRKTDAPLNPADFRWPVKSPNECPPPSNSLCTCNEPKYEFNKPPFLPQLEADEKFNARMPLSFKSSLPDPDTENDYRLNHDLVNDGPVSDDLASDNLVNDNQLNHDLVNDNLVSDNPFNDYRLSGDLFNDDLSNDAVNDKLVNDNLVNDDLSNGYRLDEDLLNDDRLDDNLLNATNDLERLISNLRSFKLAFASPTIICQEILEFELPDFLSGGDNRTSLTST